ncbi:DUF1176 domain-containing protein [Rhizobium sp.]
MPRAILPALVMLALGMVPASADEASDKADIAAASKYAEPAMNTQCQFQKDNEGQPDGYNNVFHLTYRTKGQDQDSPDYKRTLVQLACSSGAYNFNSIWVMRNDDPGEGGWELLSFAEPMADFDYADEEFTRLKAPPKVSGYVAVTQMTNSEYDEATKTISANTKWRGIGDAGSAGEWQFEEGAFLLKRYEIDPTYQPPGDQDPDPNQPESYTLFGDPRPEN